MVLSVLLCYASCMVEREVFVRFIITGMLVDEMKKEFVYGESQKSISTRSVIINSLMDTLPDARGPVVVSWLPKNISKSAKSDPNIKENRDNKHRCLLSKLAA